MVDMRRDAALPLAPKRASPTGSLLRLISASQEIHYVPAVKYGSCE